MQMPYLAVHFYIDFAKPARADNYPVFVLRSVLGRQLRRMCCISKQSVCQTCMYNKTCAYSFIFESIVEKDNTSLPGRNTISHPFCFTQNSVFVGNDSLLTSFDFTVTLFGKAIEYLPYFYAAFVRAGKEGIFKERVPFEITDVSVGSESLLIDSDTIKTDFKIENFNLVSTGQASSCSEVLVEVKTPLRFKVKGSYTRSFSAQDFWSCLYRRAKTMFLAYGIDCQEKDFPILADTLTTINNDALSWKDIKHYSARQKKVMELGGVVGSLKISGTLSDLEVKLLEFAKIANAGKNTNFGLGQIDFWVR